MSLDVIKISGEIQLSCPALAALARHFKRCRYICMTFSKLRGGGKEDMVLFLFQKEVRF